MVKFRVTFVTAFFDLNEPRPNEKSLQIYIKHFISLAYSGIPLCLYTTSDISKIIIGHSMKRRHHCFLIEYLYYCDYLAHFPANIIAYIVTVIITSIYTLTMRSHIAFKALKWIYYYNTTK